MKINIINQLKYDVYYNIIDSSLRERKLINRLVINSSIDQVEWYRFLVDTYIVPTFRIESPFYGKIIESI